MIDSTQPQFELRFQSLFDSGRGYAFPCDPTGHVDLDGLSERARNNYFYARAMVGRELAVPALRPSDLHWDLPTTRYPPCELAGESLAEFERRIAEHDEVMESYLMTGDRDYLIRVAVADTWALEKFILNQLTPIPGIEKIRSRFALKQVRYKTALPLPN